MYFYTIYTSNEAHHNRELMKSDLVRDKTIFFNTTFRFCTLIYRNSNSYTKIKNIHSEHLQNKQRK